LTLRNVEYQFNIKSLNNISYYVKLTIEYVKEFNTNGNKNVSKSFPTQIHIFCHVAFLFSWRLLSITKYSNIQWAILSCCHSILCCLWILRIYKKKKKSAVSKNNVSVETSRCICTHTHICKTFVLAISLCYMYVSCCVTEKSFFQRDHRADHRLAIPSSRLVVVSFSLFSSPLLSLSLSLSLSFSVPADARAK